MPRATILTLLAEPPPVPRFAFNAILPLLPPLRLSTPRLADVLSMSPFTLILEPAITLILPAPLMVLPPLPILTLVPELRLSVPELTDMRPAPVSIDEPTLMFTVLAPILRLFAPELLYCEPRRSRLNLAEIFKLPFKVMLPEAAFPITSLAALVFA